MNLHGLGPNKVFVFRDRDGDINWEILSGNVEVLYFNFEYFFEDPGDHGTEEVEAILAALRQMPVNNWYRQRYEHRVVEELEKLRAEDR